MLKRSNDLSGLLERRVPTKWQLFRSNPVVSIAEIIYGWHQATLKSHQATTWRAPSAQPSVTVVCTSDTHNSTFQLPDGDILLHAGDLTHSGSQAEIQSMLDWLKTQPHTHKIVIAGNHETYLGDLSTSKETGLNWGGIIYLQNSSTVLKLGDRRLKVWGSPWTPRHGCFAFQYSRMIDYWRDIIPADTDILMTHGPPKCHLDLNNGCNSLLHQLWRMPRKPILHVFGHIHAAYGQEIASFDEVQKVYESLLRAKGGILLLCAMLYQFLIGFLWHLGSSQDRRTTLMVNAAHVGGARDELRRDAIVVEI